MPVTRFGCWMFVASLILPLAVQAADTADNAYYAVTVDLSLNGAFTVGTSAAHPVTAAAGRTSSVLDGGRNQSARSFMSVRSFESHTDYLMGFDYFLFSPDPDFDCMGMNEAAAPLIEPIVSGGRQVGFQTTWEIHHDVDHLLVVQRLVARGTSMADSAAEITLEVVNIGPLPARAGVRYLWNLALGNGGGAGAPTIGLKPPEPASEPLIAFEHRYQLPRERSFIVSNESMPSRPGPINSNPYVVEGILGGIPLDPAPTPPDELLYTNAGDQVPPPVGVHGPMNTCFDYSIPDPPREAFRGPDSAVVFFWGRTPETARIILPDERLSVTEYIFAYLEFPLTCSAGERQVVECMGATTPVVLDGSGSSNSEDGILEYRWQSFDAGIAIADPTVQRPEVQVTGLGVHDVGLLVHRGPFASSCSTSVELVDTRPPEILSIRAVPSILWPPNHRLVPVAIEIEARDICEGVVSVTLVEASSNEADNGRRVGDGNTSHDIDDADLGTDDRTILLRAERNGRGDAREYTLVYDIADSLGNAVRVPVQVIVPHDQGGTSGARAGGRAWRSSRAP